MDSHPFNGEWDTKITRDISEFQKCIAKLVRNSRRKLLQEHVTKLFPPTFPKLPRQIPNTQSMHFPSDPSLSAAFGIFERSNVGWKRPLLGIIRSGKRISYYYYYYNQKQTQELEELRHSVSLTISLDCSVNKVQFDKALRIAAITASRGKYWGFGQKEGCPSTRLNCSSSFPNSWRDYFLGEECCRIFVTWARYLRGHGAE